MHDILPDIWITADVDGPSFLNRLAAITASAPKYQMQRTNFDSGGSLEGYQRLDLFPNEPTEHAKLAVQFIVDADSGHRVKVEIRAGRWHPDPPTYDTYVRVARLSVRPLLREYNLRHSSHRRLFVQPKTATEPRLPPSVWPHFNSFVRCANVLVLHPLDWVRFYRFVQACHARHLRLDETHLARMLVAAGFDEEYAREIGSVYHHCRGLLRV
jgi:hypothetical protein